MNVIAVVTRGERAVVRDNSTGSHAVIPRETLKAVHVPAQGPPGRPGVDGLPGADGAPGADAVDTFYQHSQGVPATTWTITHGLGRYPSVSVVDSAGTVVIGEVNYISANEVTVTFSVAFSGTANLT